jgi:hypothetical protein
LHDLCLAQPLAFALGRHHDFGIQACDKIDKRARCAVARDDIDAAIAAFQHEFATIEPEMAFRTLGPMTSDAGTL